MTLTDATGLPSAGLNPLSGPQQKKADSPEEAKLKKAAGDFESILLASMWKSMKQTFGAPEADESDPAQGTLSDWSIEVMSGAVGKAGGLGIGKMIMQHLQPTIDRSDNGSPDADSGIDPNK